MEVQNKVKIPWKKSLGKLPLSLEYYQGSMVEAVENAYKNNLNAMALDFLGHKVSYKTMVENIKKCSKSLKMLGIKKGDAVTVALPNCPQAVYIFYAINLIGGIANMVHPLSSEEELKFFINQPKSNTIFVLDQFYDKIKNIRGSVNLKNIVVVEIEDELPLHLHIGYVISKMIKKQTLPNNTPEIIKWKKFICLGNDYNKEYKATWKDDDTAVILYSGGTTGTSKGICLTNFNFNVLAKQVFSVAPNNTHAGDKMLCIMPLFHGFGLGVCTHTTLVYGGECVLMPTFSLKSYEKLLLKNKCNFIMGVPTLFEALLKVPAMQKADLSFLKGVFCGGDSLSGELKVRVDKFLAEHNSPVPIQEGYGTTETVTACCFSPYVNPKLGSCGLPFPDTFIKIVKPNTDIEVPYGEEGEILLAGPTVMKGYLNNPEETKNTLRKHADGLTWVYTGDIGYMDEDGFTFFKGRIKRVIISSGYNIFPNQLEDTIQKCEYVHQCCVIGVPDKYKMQRVKVFIVLKPNISPSDDTKDKILEFCKNHIAKYAIPKEIEFLKDLPTTNIGKIDYRALEEKYLG